MEKNIIRVGPDSYGGVGLFALTNIAKNIRLDICQDEDVKFVNKKHIQTEAQKRMFQIFGVATQRGYWVPKSFNSMSIGWLINHSEHPNLEWRSVGKDGNITYFTKRLIKKGEELTVNYNSMSAIDNIKSRGKYWKLLYK